MDINVRTLKVQKGTLKIGDTFMFHRCLCLVVADGANIIIVNLNSGRSVSVDVSTKVTPINVSIVLKD